MESDSADQNSTNSVFIWNDDEVRNYQAKQIQEMKEFRKNLENYFKSKRDKSLPLREYAVLSSETENQAKSSLFSLDIDYAHFTTYHKQLERQSLQAHSFYCQYLNSYQEYSINSKKTISDNQQKVKKYETEEFKKTEGDVKLLKYELAQKEQEYNDLLKKSESLAKQAESKRKLNEQYDEYLNYTLLQEEYERLQRQAEQKEKYELELRFKPQKENIQRSSLRNKNTNFQRTQRFFAMENELDNRSSSFQTTRSTQMSH